MKLKVLLTISLLLGMLSFAGAWQWKQSAAAARVNAVALERLGIDRSAVLKSAPNISSLSPLAFTITQIRTLTDKDGVDRYHLTRQRLARADGSFIERTTYNDGRIMFAWSSADGKYLEYTKGGKVIRHYGEAGGLPDPAQVYRRAREQNLLMVTEQGLPACIDTSQADDPQRRTDFVRALQINLPLRVAHFNGRTTTVSLLKGEPDKDEWDRLKAAIPANLPVVDGQ